MWLKCNSYYLICGKIMSLFNNFVIFQFTDDICDYFGVKIAMYFAWLGFYTTSMLYPAVIGFVLWMLTESDQVRREASFA